MRRRSASRHDGVPYLPKQLAYLERLGVTVPANLSEQEASELIDQAVVK